MTYIVRAGRNLIQGHIQIYFDPSCVRRVYFIRKSTEFHVMWTDCQIIIINLLPLISHISPTTTKVIPSSVKQTHQ